MVVETRLVALADALEKQGLDIEDDYIQSSKFCQAFVNGETDKAITAERVANNCCVRKFQFEYTGYQNELERLYNESKELRLNKSKVQLIDEAKDIAFRHTPIPNNSAWPWLPESQQEARQQVTSKKKKPKSKATTDDDGWTTVMTR